VHKKPFKKVYIIVGPTAVGKTDVAVTLAERLETAIISADSRQCYREMAIGTAKPTANEMRQVPHYFIDAFPVTTIISAADFEGLALQYLDEIFETNDTAVVCGGTGLYVKALTDGLDEMPGTDAQIADQVDRLYKENGLAWLQQTVEAEDPVFYGNGEVQNPARLLRALVFVRSNGVSINRYKSHAAKVRRFDMVKVGLELPRVVLYERINSRVDRMMADGLLAEVERLMPYRHLKNLQTVGYTELFDYLDGSCTLAEAIEKIKQHSRNYAKRQLTWFKKDPNVNWLMADDPLLMDKILAL
jgi:tRNA dimethylallyltransferase